MSQFSANANDFGARIPPILSNLVELAQAQKCIIDGILTKSQETATQWIFID